MAIVTFPIPTVTVDVNDVMSWKPDAIFPTSLRNSRLRLRRLRQGNGGQFVMSFAGDSWVQGDIFWLRQFTKAMHDEYGFAGIGFVGFQYFGASSGDWVDGGAQPSGGGAGCSRGDLVPNPTFDGQWTADNGAQPGGIATPSIGHVTTSDPLAYVRFTVPSGHNAADLFYVGTTDTGSVEYSWDAGTTWQTAITLTGADGVCLSVPLANVPAGAATLRLRRVSGTIRLAGVNLKSAAPGVVVHKLGAGGGNSNMWLALDLAEWAGLVADLGAHSITVILGTNDQAGAMLPATMASNISAMMAAIEAESVTIDRLMLMPPENIRTPPSVHPMTAYAAAIRAQAITDGFAFVDLQCTWGPVAADYAHGAAFPLMDASNGHPAPATGGAIIADTMHRLLGAAL